MTLSELAAPGDTTPVSQTPPLSLRALPAQSNSFVGRQREAVAVGKLLHAARLVTLTGPGGVGKTRLAVEVASGASEAFTDGVIFIALASVTDSALVGPTIARALGIPEPVDRRLPPCPYL